MYVNSEIFHCIISKEDKKVVFRNLHKLKIFLKILSDMKNFFTSEKRRIYWFKTKKLSVELPKRKHIYILCSISVAWRHRCEPAVWLPVPDPRILPLAGPCTPRSCWDRTWPVSSGCTYRMCTQGTTFNFSFVLSHVWLLSFSFLFVLFSIQIG